MSDNSTPQGTDLNSAAAAISAMMAPLEDKAPEAEAQDVLEDDASILSEEYEEEEQSLDEYEDDHDDGDDVDQDDSQTLDILAATVEVDGEELTVEELKNGHLRQRDYTRKTQELAEIRKSMEAELAEVEQERQMYAQGLPLLVQRIQALAIEEPDWDTLYDADPVMAAKAERQFRKQQEERQAQLQAVRQEQERLHQIEVQKAEKLKAQYVDQQRQILPDLIPEWRDSRVAESEAQKLRTFLLSEGFSEEDVNGLKNATLVKVARKAMLYDQGKSRATQAKKKPAKRTAKTLKSGSRGSQPKPKSGAEQARQRFRQTGSVNDAANYIKSLL